MPFFSAGVTQMLIRLGYEIAIECLQPTPVISVLEIHKDRQKDIKRQTRVLTLPSTPSHIYEDRYGNICRRFLAPAGGFRILYDAVIEDSGEPDETNTQAGETPIEELPDDVIGYLLGSRYCETDHLAIWRGTCSARRQRVGQGCRRSSTMCTTGFPSATAMRGARERPPRRMKNVSASAVILRIWRSRSAAA